MDEKKAKRSKRRDDSRMADLRRCPTWLREEDDRLLLFVHLQPGARHTGCRGEHGERLKIAVSAPPIEGRANDALTNWLAERLELPRQSVRITAGERGRDKTIRIEGISAALARARLADQ